MLKRGTCVIELSRYCDLDLDLCPNTRISIIGYMVKLGDSLISYKPKNQQTISRSFAKVEYISLAALVA